MPNIVCDFKITFEDNTRINFSHSGVTEIVPGNDKVVRHRQLSLVKQIHDACKGYINATPQQVKE